MINKHIHFIGICGVAMGGLAIAFKEAGFKVTGSDVGFFPPVSTNLEKHGIEFYPGWHPEKMGTPDLVVVGNVASSTNPEWLFVQEHKLNYKSYPEAIAEYFVKENSLVCAGTYGKTSTSALLAFILTECDYSPNYMFGGLAVDDFPSAKISDSKYSVLEGDEYKSSKWDNGAKFFHYHPTHLLLTAIEWDHADVYPTEKLYFEAFEQLTASIPNNGIIIASEKIKIKRLEDQKTKMITYGKSDSAIYQYNNITMTKNGIKFDIIHNSKIYNLHSPMLGNYMAENICGGFAMAYELGMEAEKIITAIAKFSGLKRRLEKRFTGAITIFDDIAHSPAKAKAVLENLRQIYTGKIFCIFEPNTGNRQPQSIPSYNQAFINADEVIIPRLTKLKTSEELHHFEGNELADIISQTHSSVKYIDEDEKLINYLTNSVKKDGVIVFCGSHGFRGMIDELIKKYENS